MIEAHRTLVVGHVFLAHVEIIVGVIACADYGGLSHHGHTAHVHGVRLRRVFIQHDGCGLRELIRWDHIQHAVVGELLADVLRIRRAGRQAGIVVGIWSRAIGVVDIHAALAEIAGVFSRSWHGVNHGVHFRVPQCFIVQEEESLASALDWAAKRGAKVVLHQEIRSAHLVEGVGVHVAIAKELVSRAVEVAGPGTRDDVDLATPGAAHVGRVTPGLHLKLLHCVGGGAQVLGAERGVGVGGSVKQEVIGVGTASADADRRPLARPPIKRIHVAGCGAVADVSSGQSDYQIDQHAAIQGEGIDRALIHYIAHARILRLEQLTPGLNRDGLAFRSQA